MYIAAIARIAAAVLKSVENALKYGASGGNVIVR